MPAHSPVVSTSDLCLCISHLSLRVFDLIDDVIYDPLLFSDLPVDFLLSIVKCPLFLLALDLDCPPDLLSLLVPLLLPEMLHLQLVYHGLPLEAKVCQLKVFGLAFFVQMDKLAFKLSNQLPFLLQVRLECTRDMMLSRMSNLVQVYEGNVVLYMLA